MSDVYRVVCRLAGFGPERLARFIMHAERNGGDLRHVEKARSYLNQRLIGEADWAERALDEIAEMKAENFNSALEKLQKRRRKSEIRALLAQGPSDPWRPTEHGPMREVILTANAKWFDGAEAEPDEALLNQREYDFQRVAVSWLKDNFGDDVIQAHCDRDEKASHIHAVIFPRARDRQGRRVLQPSIHPLIADYEAAQDSIGEAVAEIGLTRGQARKKAYREALMAGVEPPEQVHHKTTTQWREEQAIALAQEQRGFEEERAIQEDLFATGMRNIVEKEAELDAQIDAVKRDKAHITAQKHKLAAERGDAQSKTAEADAIIAVAEGLAAGTLDIDTSEDAPKLVTADTSASADHRARRHAIKAAPKGARRAVAAFGKAWFVLKDRAEKVAREQVSTEFRLIKKAQSALTGFISKLSPDARAKTDPEIKSFAQAVGQLTHLIERRGTSGPVKENQSEKQ